MAEVTDRLITINEAYVEVTYDDVTFELSDVHVHTGAVPVTVRIFRKNGNAVWKEEIIPAGTDQNYPLPAGPIRFLDDLPSWGLMD